jgi:predicted CoA-binding protein
MPLTQDSDIKQLLENTKTVAVVGYSNKPDRPSNEIANALKTRGFEVYPVNPILAGKTDERIYSTLADIPVPIDVVDVFRRPEEVPEVVGDAIAIGAKAVWMQLGIVNDEAAKRAEDAGLQVVMDHCMKVESGRLLHR